MAGVYYLTCLCLALLLGSSASNIIPLTDRVIFPVPTQIPIVPFFITPSSEQSCLPSYFFITINGNQTCLYSIDSTGYMSSSCSLFGNMRSIVCRSGSCVGFDPSISRFTFFYYLGYIDAQVNVTQTVSFYDFSNYIPAERGSRVFFVEGLTNSVIWNVFFFSFASALPAVRVGSLQNSKKIVGFALLSERRFIVSYEAETTLYIYSSDNASFIGTYGTFGSVGPIAVDNNAKSNRLFVTDYANDCIQIIDILSDFAHGVINEISTISSISPLLGGVFVKDSVAGYVTYLNDPFKIENVIKNDVTCSSIGGSFTMRVRGGSYYYSYGLLPDRATLSSTYSNIGYTQFTYNIDPVNPQVAPITIYSNYIHPVCKLTGTITNVNMSDASVALNGTSISAKIFGGSSFSINCAGNIFNPYQYQVELMINLGQGGQTIGIGPDCTLPSYVTISTATSPPNTWTKATIMFPSSSSDLYFCDRANVNASLANIFYIDDIKLTPNNGTRYMTVFDQCLKQQLVSPPFVIKDDNTLKITSLNSQSTSCNNDTSNNILSANGAVNVTAVGGFQPYIYKWGFSSATTNNISGLSATDYNIVIYDNKVNSKFSDTGIATNKLICDTTKYKSSPCSISFTTTSENEGLSYNFVDIDSPFSGNDFYALEFYINGGLYGAQVMSITLKYKAGNVGVVSNVAKLANLAALPPNQWVLVRYPIPVGLKFTGVQIYTPLAIDPAIRSPLYIDDITLLSYKSIVTVKDSQNCLVESPYVKVLQPAAISISDVTSNVQCFGDSDGKIMLNPIGGTSPYYYTWSVAGATGESLSRLGESQIQINVTDSLGCIPTAKSLTLNVLQPPKLDFKFTMEPAQCHGGQGRLIASSIGGVGPYTYIWISKSTSSYSVVAQPQPFEIFTDHFDSSTSLSSTASNTTTVDCSGTGSHLRSAQQMSHSGYCSLKTEPGIVVGRVLGIRCSDCFDQSLYSELQLWINFARPIDAELCSIRFYKGNSSVSNSIPLESVANKTIGTGWQLLQIPLDPLREVADRVSISNSGAIKFFLVDDIVLFPKDSNLLVRGITVNVGFKSVIQGVAAPYILSLSDGNGCNSLFEVNITQPEALVVSSTRSKPKASDDSGAISLAVFGGIPPYTYLWYGMSKTLNTSSYRALRAGEYTILVSDANGCFVNHTVLLEAQENSSKTNAGMIAGIALGIGAVVIAAAIVAGVYIKRQRKHVLLALIEAEEGERRNYKIDFDQLDVGVAIGAGSFGEVYSGVYKGADIAIKRLKSQQMAKAQIDEFAREAAVMVGLRHPNILLFMGVCVEPANLCIVTEMMPRGNLMEVLRDQDINLPHQIIFKMALDTLKGLQFLHSSGFIHRDLKSPNLLVDKYWNIKIADFGLSVAHHHVSDNAQVSLLWTAPEILRRDANCYSFASDMFSFGVILWELVSKDIPWNGMYPPAITAKVVSGERPAVDPEWNQSVINLINSSWNQQIDARPTVKEARSILEGEIIPAIGTLDMGSMFEGSFSSKETPSGTLRAPPPQPPLALVCCSISNASEIWESDPRGMAKGLEGMFSIFRKLCISLSGYEITQDSPYIYAFANPSNAINFCLRAQIELRKYDWPKSLLACYFADETKSESTVLQRGLRVKMAVHWCDPVLRKDSFTMKPTYVGEAMNESIQLLKHGMGGATIVDQDMYNRILSPSSGVDAFSINPLGVVPVGDSSLPIFKLVPASLKDLLDISELNTSGGSSDSKDSWLIDFEDFKLSSIIGSGAFGDVYSALLGDKKVAVKKFVRHAVSSALLLEMRIECAVLSHLNHKNIVKFEGMCLKVPNLCLVTELMERGSLSGVLYSSVDLPWSRKISFAKDIACGMAYLHRNEIVHRDIKSPNLLVDSNWNIKIADFGFSRIKSVNQTMTQCGTVSWTAPEIFAGGQYTEKADVFSFGVVLWELIFRKRPWDGRHAMKIISVIESGGRLPVSDMPNDVPKTIKTIMAECWDHDPQKRPSFDDIEDQLSEL